MQNIAILVVNKAKVMYKHRTYEFFRRIFNSLFLALSISLPNAFSHANILITRTPVIISSINLMRLSVRKAVFNRYMEDSLPVHAAKKLI